MRSHPDTTNGELSRLITDEFADDEAKHRGSDGAPFSSVSDSGIAGTPVVQRVADDIVRVAVLYAEAPLIPTGPGDMYCLVIDVPTQGATNRRTVWADFTRPDHCAHAHREVARP